MQSLLEAVASSRGILSPCLHLRYAYIFQKRFGHFLDHSTVFRHHGGTVLTKSSKTKSKQNNCFNNII